MGAIVIVAASAATTAGAGFSEIHGFVSALNQTPAPDLGHELTPASAGAPQTILLLGSDKRASAAIDAASPPHTDTMMLARIDPARGAITLMSIPRDLEVSIDVPGRGPTNERINAAYSIGGPRLAIATVKSLLHISVNHLVDTNFAGFRRAVDYLGCVYVEIDHRYFNDNSGPDQYATINVAAGYQRLCGHDALDYVRYRHTDSDFVRVARQQDFLRQARDQVGGAKIISKRQELAGIFGRATETDIHSSAAVLRLLEALLLASGHSVRQVQFQATAGPSLVTATPQQVQQSVRDFLGSSPGERPAGAPRPRHGQSGAAVPDLAPAPELGQAAAQSLAGSGLKLYYPQLLRAGAVYDAGSRAYTIKDQHGHPHRAYRLVVRMASPGDYYGVEGTDWMTPPILAHPSETRVIAGRHFELFFAGSRLRLVSWRDGGAVYWLSNTLVEALTPQQMLALAASTRPLA